MRSWQSIVVKRIIMVKGLKKKFKSSQSMQQFINQKLMLAPYTLNKRFLEKHAITKKISSTMDYYVLNEQANPKKIIYYFAGGAYVNDPLPEHWNYLVNLARETAFMIVVPIYPKLPNSTYADCYEAVHALYDTLVVTYSVPFIFMGDSAGGGLALGFAQDVKKLGKPLPEQVVLFSPWLDMVGEDPQYIGLEKVDPVTGLAGAQVVRDLWSGHELPTHYQISPLYGDIQGIGRITVFVGTHELLLVDARKLLQKAMKEKVDILYFEYPKMNHVFPIYPIPEAKKVLHTLVPILRKEA